MNRRNLSVRSAMEALEEVRTDKYPEGVRVGFDPGVHANCYLDSNCPKAVQLRNYMMEMGFSMEQLASAHEASLAEGYPPPIEWNGIEFEGRATLRIAGTSVSIDLTDSLRQAYGDAFDQKIRELNHINSTMANLGSNLYNTYLEAIDRARRTSVLPMLDMSKRELLSARCSIVRERNNYLFLFNREYRPSYLVQRGLRYELAQEDKDSLVRDIVLSFRISKELKILRVDALTPLGDYFEHYHGRDWDCWGDIRYPEQWETFQQLVDLVHRFEISLRTINMDSLMMREPEGMIPVSDILYRSTVLGEEGIREEPANREHRTTTPGPRAPRRWGEQRPA